MKRNRIPAEPFRSIVLRYVNSQDWIPTQDGEHYNAPTIALSSVRALAIRAGVNEDSLWTFLRAARHETTDFDFADKVFCAMPGGPFLWHTPEMEPIWNSVDLSEPEPRPEPIPGRICKDCDQEIVGENAVWRGRPSKVFRPSDYACKGCSNSRRRDWRAAKAAA